MIGVQIDPEGPAAPVGERLDGNLLGGDENAPALLVALEIPSRARR